jgi:nucleoside-diphosphate-sugar epimerase
MNLNKKKILILGSDGYVGSMLVNYFKKKNIYKLIGVDAKWFCKINSKKKYRDVDRKDVRHFNLRSVNFIPEAIIYLAAISNDPMGKEFKEVTDQINFKECLRLAKSAKALGVKKFIFASSCSIYGASGSKIRKESDKLLPITDYAISKVNAEKALRYVSSKKFKVISLRFATAAGWSPNLRLDLVFNDFVASAVLKNKIELLSNGDAWRPLIHVNDMARAIHWAIKYKSFKNFLPINIGSNNWNFKILDLAKKISYIIGNVRVITSNKKTKDKRSYKVDFSLFRKLAPNHQPVMNITKSVNHLKKFLNSKKNSLNNFRSSEKWSRLANLKYLIKKNYINKKLFWKKNA